MINTLRYDQRNFDVELVDEVLELPLRLHCQHEASKMIGVILLLGFGSYTHATMFLLYAFSLAIA